MSYSSQKQQFQNRKTGHIASFYGDFLRREHYSDIKSLNGEYYTHLFQDLIERIITLDFNQVIESNIKSKADDFAKECIKLQFKSKDLHGKQVKYWTENALKSFDEILIYYIQDICNERLPHTIYDGKIRIKESDTYYYLYNKTGDLKTVGECFKSIYHKRNTFTHIQRASRDGRRITLPLTNKYYDNSRDEILSWFKISCDILLNIFTDYFKQVNSNP